MSRCYYCATTKTTCPACTRRALEQAVIDAAKDLDGLEPGDNDLWWHVCRVVDAVRALDGGAE